jgi:hypothetical protein
MEQQIVITSDSSKINELIRQGWRVTSVTAQHISSGGSSYGSIRGEFCFVLERS